MKTSGHHPSCKCYFCEATKQSLAISLHDFLNANPHNYEDPPDLKPSYEITPKPCSEITTGLPSGPCTLKSTESKRPHEQIKILVDEYGFETVLEGIAWTLKQLKNPERYVFVFYMFARKAFKEITKEVKAGS